MALIVQKETNISFKFSGLLADNGELAASDIEHSMSGMRRLLSAYAHSYATGETPKFAKDSGKFYNVRFKAFTRGSVFADFAVQFAAGLAVLCTWGLFTNYGSFLMENIRLCFNDELPVIPFEERKEPYFERLDGGNHPFLDFSAEIAWHQNELRRITAIALREAARPVGRSAENMQILTNAQNPIFIGPDELTRLDRMRDACYETAINQFVHSKKQLQLRSPSSNLF